MTLILREDMFSVTVTVDGKNLGVWESRSGGTGDSDDTKVRKGAMGPELSLGGPQTRENINLKKLFDADGIGKEYVWLDARRGRGDVTVVTQPLDKDGNIHGSGWSNKGVLKSVSAPDYDAQSNDPAYIEIEVTPQGDLA